MAENLPRDALSKNMPSAPRESLSMSALSNFMPSATIESLLGAR